MGLATVCCVSETLILCPLPHSNKPNPNQLSVNSVKPGGVGGLVNGSGAAAGAAVGAGGLPGALGVISVPPGQIPGLGRACESCYSE